MKSITIVAPTEIQVTQFQTALKVAGIKPIRLSHSESQGLVSATLPDQYDMVRLARALDARNLKRYVPDFEGDARRSIWQMVEGFCGGRAK